MGDAIGFLPSIRNVSSVPAVDFPSPFVFLTPAQVHDMNLATYLHVGATGVMIWDFLDNLRNDFNLPLSGKSKFPTLMYFVVRIALVAYCLGRAALLTLPIRNCATLAQILNVLLAINGIAETGLCYLRVIMVYCRNPYIVAFFSSVWLTAVAMTLTIFKTFGAAHIPNTLRCVESVKGPLAIPTLSAWVGNDSLIYLAIVYRIYNIFQTYDFGPDSGRRWAFMVFGASLPTVGSKIVLLESQLYCLIIIVSKVTLLVLVSIDMDRYIMFLVCHLVLVTILVSRVFRELMQSRKQPHLKPNAEFQTGNLTTAEFCPNGSISAIPQGMSKRTFASQVSMSAAIGPCDYIEGDDISANRKLSFPEDVYSPRRHYRPDEV